MLADNAIAQKKATHNTVPRLRACFHVGSSYEFHQSEGLNPTLYNYIVGDVTVDVARVIERAMPGQILVGDFRAEMPTGDAQGGASHIVESADFVELAMRNVEQLAGLELSGERVDAIRCYLTGTKLANGQFTVRRITVNDKHGISRRVYNAKSTSTGTTPNRSCWASRIGRWAPTACRGSAASTCCDPRSPERSDQCELVRSRPSGRTPTSVVSDSVS